MKKSLAMMLAALTLLLSACGGKIPSDSTRAPDDSETKPASTAVPQESKKPAKGTQTEMFPLKGTIEETVLVDQDGVKITATGLDYTDYAAELSLVIENNTEQDLSFTGGTLGYACNSVNGYMVDSGYINADIPASKKANETVLFNADELRMFGITDIADLEIGIEVSNENYDTILKTGPLPIKTSLAASYDYATDTYQNSINGGMLAEIADYTLDHFAQDTLFDQCGVRTISQALATNAEGEKILLLEVENTSEDQVIVTTWNHYLNGLKVQDKMYSGDTVNVGKRRVISIQFSNMVDDAYWDAFELTELGEFTFSMGLKDEDYNDLCDLEEVSVKVPGVHSSFDDKGEQLYNEDGIQIVFKGLVADDSDYSADIHALFLVRNDGQIPVDVGVGYDSVSVNGFMTDCWYPSRGIVPGRSGIMDLSLRDDSLEENHIAGMDEIEEIEMTFEVRDEDYDTLAEPVVTVTLNR